MFAAVPGVVTSYKVIDDFDADPYKKSIPPPIATADEKENREFISLLESFDFL